MPSNVNYTPQGMNFTQSYYPMVDPQTLMNQFAQFMSMMGTQQAVPPQPAPVEFFHQSSLGHRRSNVPSS